MELVKVYERYYQIYKIVTDEDSYSIPLLIFDGRNLVVSANVAKDTGNIFNFVTTSSFTYSNLELLQKDLNEALKTLI